MLGGVLGPYMTSALTSCISQSLATAIFLFLPNKYYSKCCEANSGKVGLGVYDESIFEKVEMVS